LAIATLFFIAILMMLRISKIPWEFSYLVTGRILGPILGMVFLVLILIAVLLIPAKILSNFLNSATNGKPKEIWAIIKNRKTMRMVLLGLALSLMVVFVSSFIFMTQVSRAGQKIDLFVAVNANRSFQDYVDNVSSFLNDNVQNAYNRPEALFKIDNEVSGTLLDPYVMKGFGITRADLIVYQGWGTCEQAAILIEELLHDAGYQTREAYFKNIDHQWAEANYNGKWLIIDPWYIGNLVDIQNLKNLKPEFQQAAGVKVLYSNGTIFDANHEHGY
jgi:hypothetical protein